MRAASWDYTDGLRRWDHRDVGNNCAMFGGGTFETRRLVHDPPRIPGTKVVDTAGFYT